MSDQGYVHEGTDRRARGLIGKILASVQRSESFKSPFPPRLIRQKTHRNILWFRKVEIWEYRSEPGNKPFTVILYYRKDGLVDTYRVGHRYDHQWGDEGTVGFNPNPEIVGGYIFDIIIKAGRTPEDAATYVHY